MPVGIYPRGPRGDYKSRYHGSCYCCGTYNPGQYSWYRNRDDKDNALCGLCYRRLISNPKWNPITRKKWSPINNKRRQTFKGKHVRLDHNPRIGVCNLCRAVAGIDCKVTNMHHEEYDDSDTLRYTIEVCVRCHRSLEPKVSYSCYACGRDRPTKAGWYHNYNNVVMCGSCHVRYIYRRSHRI
jgi:hypothetical protein